MRKTITALTLSSALIAAGAAQAQTPGQGNFHLSITDLFSEPLSSADPGAPGLNPPDSPTYNFGYFVSDDIMPYGSLIVSSGDDTNLLLRGGSRFYMIPGDTGNLRTFIDGELTYWSNGNDALGLGSHFGLEYFVSSNFSVSGRVGAEFVNPDEGDSSITIGSAGASANFYF
ncbi:hypothetical protein [Aquisalimonas asiatica]|uniref:Outer membrane protein beta-barrel domain-containing protein n=1 Tax=Aquisalimonas asiatica TaxID=406100 RepID=A0A1H8V6X2_9GAMM|nr:hypothetical protein [Aquisalimonas asiatica]SEP10994.1 hypothetical protein SAMN04488052_11032 [Aquisalimonas asiatica]